MSLNVLSSFKNKTTLIVGISLWQNIQLNCLNKNLHCTPGIELTILQTIAEILKLDLVLKISKEPGCGSVNSNGTWSGLMGMLQRKEIDITGNLCGIDKSRANTTWFSHSYPVIQDKRSFIIRAPNPKFEFSLEAPFQMTIWYILFAYCFVISFYFIFYYWFWRVTVFKLAIVKAASSFVKINFGFDPPLHLSKYNHLLFEGFRGFVTMLYSTFITVAVLSPVCVHRPFTNSRGVVDLLWTGQLKRADYYKNSTGRCFNDLCTMLQKIIDEKAYVYFNPDNKNYINNLMSAIADENSALVFTQLDLWLRFYLDMFKDRQKIWHLPDDDSVEERLAYYYQKGFPLAESLDVCVKFLDSFKDNIRLKLFGLSIHAVHSNTIKGSIPVKFTIDWRLFNGLIQLYLKGTLISIALLVLEKLCKLFQKKAYSLIVEDQFLRET